MVASGGGRRLRRERPFGDTGDDPMWTTSRAIDLGALVPTPPPPPPYVLPPAYTDEDNTGAQNVAQTTTTAATAPRMSPARSVSPAPAHAEQPATTTTSPANTQTTAAILNGRQSQSPPPSSPTTASASRPGAMVDDGPSSQLSDKAAGKKRRRDDDDDDDDDDDVDYDSEGTVACSSGASRSSSQEPSDEPEHKRVKIDPTTSTERLPIPEILLDIARRHSYPELTLKERRHQYEKLRSLGGLFRRTRGEYF